MKHMSLTLEGIFTDGMMAKVAALQQKLAADPRAADWSDEIKEGLFHTAVVCAVAGVATQFSIDAAIGTMHGGAPMRLGHPFPLAQLRDTEKDGLTATLTLEDVQ